MKGSQIRKIVERRLKQRFSEDMEKRNAVFNYMKKVLDPEHKWRKKRDAAHERPEDYEYYVKKILLKNGGRSIPPKVLQERIKHEVQRTKKNC